MIKDDLGNRMKDFYENRAKSFLIRRIPVIVRLDGKSFHTFCKRFQRPYDKGFNESMNLVMQYVCSNVQGAKFAERHSDEISILLTDYENVETDAFFEYNIQKIVSVVASMATSELCRLLSENETISKKEKWPMFDCRCFNVPKEDISNYYWWRMLDGKRNSINMQAQSKFSHKELQGKTCNEMQEMLFQKFGINWGKLPQGEKTGYICYKETVSKVVEKGLMKGKIFNRNVWTIHPSPSTKNSLDTILLDCTGVNG